MSSTLDQYKTDTEKQLERKKAAAQQTADISHQKLMKYLPQQTKGYSVGMTETAKIAANNAYQRQLAQAEADYSDGMTQLNNYVRQEQERLDDKAKAEQDKLFSEAKGIIEGGVWNTGEELTNYVKGLEGKVSADQYGILSQYAGSIANSPEQKEADAVTAAKDGSTSKTVTGSAVWYDDDSGFWGWGTADASGDNIEVQIPGADNEDLNVQYDQEIGGEEATIIRNAFLADHGRELKDGEVFGYDHKIYVYKNGTLWSLTGRGGSTGTGDYGELYKHYFG